MASCNYSFTPYPARRRRNRWGLYLRRQVQSFSAKTRVAMSQNCSCNSRGCSNWALLCDVVEAVESVCARNNIILSAHHKASLVVEVFEDCLTGELTLILAAADALHVTSFKDQVELVYFARGKGIPQFAHNIMRAKNNIGRRS